MVPLLIDHILTALFQYFSLLVYAGPDLAGFDAGLLQRVFHSFGRLLAQFDAFLLKFGARLFSRLRRQQQHRHRGNQSTYQQSGYKAPQLIDVVLVFFAMIVHSVFSLKAFSESPSSRFLV
jgi:hypothetical protein